MKPGCGPICANIRSPQRRSSGPRHPDRVKNNRASTRFSRTPRVNLRMRGRTRTTRKPAAGYVSAYGLRTRGAFSQSGGARAGIAVRAWSATEGVSGRRPAGRRRRRYPSPSSTWVTRRRRAGSNSSPNQGLRRSHRLFRGLGWGSGITAGQWSRHARTTSVTDPPACGR